ncbi:MAG: hypothetical protein NWQ19_01775 [Nonlabens sp.]|nr:hypothetical protein [Nonlabens sp.]
MKSILTATGLLLLLLTSCSKDDDVMPQVSNTVPTLTKYKRISLDVTANPPVPKDSVVTTVLNGKIQEVTSYVIGGSTTVSQYNYTNQLLTSIVAFSNGAATGVRADYTYDSAGLITAYSSIGTNLSISETYNKVQDTTFVTATSSLNGMPFGTPSMYKVAFNADGRIVYFENREDINSLTTRSEFQYDAAGNLTTEILATDNDNGNNTIDNLFSMTYTNTVNPLAALRNNTFGMYFNHLRYHLRNRGLNVTIGPTFLSTNWLNTYEYTAFQGFPTTLVNEFNAAGLIERVTYTTLGGNTSTNGILTSFIQEFYY